MMKDKKKLAGILIALNLAFIWGNSMRVGSDSQALSMGILEFFDLFLNLEEIGAIILHILIRKGAHFAEFATLGALLAWHCRLSDEKHAIAFPVLLGMAAGLVDETIQLITPNRGPSLADVWLDTSGVVAGVLLLILGHHLRKRKHNP